jgi:hypothetical protein
MLPIYFWNAAWTEMALFFCLCAEVYPNAAMLACFETQPIISSGYLIRRS